jgi:hypothetical protein
VHIVGIFGGPRLVIGGVDRAYFVYSDSCYVELYDTIGG